MKSSYYIIDNTDLPSACGSSEPLSIQLDSKTQESDQQKKSTEKLKISRIMTVPRKTIDNIIPDNDSNSVHQQKKYYVKNQFSDVQLDKLPIDTSPPKAKKFLKYKRKNKLPVVSKKCARRPSWVSPTTNSYPFKKSLNQTSLSFQQLRNPCQILEVYTQFKRINCKPYSCISTPLPPCLYIKNAHIC